MNQLHKKCILHIVNLWNNYHIVRCFFKEPILFSKKNNCKNLILIFFTSSMKILKKSLLRHIILNILFSKNDNFNLLSNQITERADMLEIFFPRYTLQKTNSSPLKHSTFRYGCSWASENKTGIAIQKRKKISKESAYPSTDPKAFPYTPNTSLKQSLVTRK